jgi:magnesium-protoporphyrin IX monomethyl ester (oxidative) cyclase
LLREIINKPLKLDRVHAIVQAARMMGMGLSAFFVIGFPGETRSEIEQTFDFAMNMGADQVHFFTATPYPGTALFKQCVDEGLIPASIDYANLRIGQLLFDTPEWTATALAEMTQDAQARFYRRAAWRHPVRFATTVARKFAREPRMTMRKAMHTLLPSTRRAIQPAGDVLEASIRS